MTLRDVVCFISISYNIYVDGLVWCPSIRALDYMLISDKGITLGAKRLAIVRLQPKDKNFFPKRGWSLRINQTKL